MTTQRQLFAEANRLAGVLKKHNLKIVFAESCTGGLISAALTRVPGISAYHCGSAVVYQVETKQAWLGISARMLKNPGPVSSAVAEAMATNILKTTPHANCSAAVTGHLGPGVPKRDDGLLYAALATRPSSRHAESPKKKGRPKVIVKKHRLINAGSGPKRLRVQRQIEAAYFVLKMARLHLQ